MENNTYYQEFLYNRHSDIVWTSWIFIIIGCVIGIIGNSIVIYFYFFRIKDRGERYFIPLLAIVDLLGCIILPINKVFTTQFMYSFPGQTTCRVLMFLRVSIPGISAHMLLLISMQRYLLVCKPFRPKMTPVWKRISFGIVCLVTGAYSSPLLFIGRVLKKTIKYRNLNITVEMCTYFELHTPLLRAYTILLLVIVVANSVLTAGFYIPVLKRLYLRFSVKKSKIKKKDSFDSIRRPPVEARRATFFKNGRSHIDKMRNLNMTQALNRTENVLNSSKKVEEEANDQQFEPTAAVLSSPTEKKTLKTKLRSSHSRITTMFLVLLVTYLLSYIPPVVLSIVYFHLEDFTPLTMTKGETAVWYLLPGLLVIHHIINPLIYGCFDNMFRSQLRKPCQKKLFL